MRTTANTGAAVQRRRRRLTVVTTRFCVVPAGHTRAAGRHHQTFTVPTLSRRAGLGTGRDQCPSAGSAYRAGQRFEVEGPLVALSVDEEARRTTCTTEISAVEVRQHV